MYSAGAVSDEDLRKEACEMMKSQKSALNERVPLIDTKALDEEPEWRTELDAVLVEYWETGETPEHLDEEWFDEMIERVIAQAVEEENKQSERKKKAGLKKGLPSV